MQEVNATNWQSEVLDKDTVLIEFWADWCNPCKAMNPILERLEENMPALTVVKVNADAEPDLTSKLGVSSLPTMILYKRGEHVWTQTGAKPLGRLVELIAPYV